MMPCPHCGYPATTKRLWCNKMTLFCGNFPTCDAYVELYKGFAKGRLANHILREWQKQANEMYYLLVVKKFIAERKKDSGYKEYQAKLSARKWLASKMAMDFRCCHIGRFDMAQCQRVIEICKPYTDK